MGIEVRVCTDDEFERWLEVCSTTFGLEVREGDVERVRRILEIQRAAAAFDDDELIGTAAAFSFTLTVPGGYAPAAGVTMVGVLPSHRRRGFLTTLMRAQLDDIRDRAEPLAVLWASEGNIYERYGYGISTLSAPIDIERERTSFREDHPPVGKVRLIEQAEAVKVLPGVYDRVCAQTPGMFARSEDWWEAHRLFDPEHFRDGGSRMFHAVLEIEGRAEGYALYRVHNEWADTSPTGYLNVIEAFGTSAVATREMWRFLFGVDLIARIKAFQQPVDHPLFMMISEPRRLRVQVSDGLWLRIVDVKAALEARSYAQDGSIVFEVDDSFCPWNTGRWRMEVTHGRAVVEKTETEPDLRLGIQHLGSVYLGGFTLSRWAHAGAIEELSPEAAWYADGLFRSAVAPYCPEIF
jgi:predicted acetyltransferase